MLKLSLQPYIFLTLFVPPLDLGMSLGLFTKLHSCSCCWPIAPTHIEFVCVSPGWSLAWLSVSPLSLFCHWVRTEYIFLLKASSWQKVSLGSSAETSAFYFYPSSRSISSWNLTEIMTNIWISQRNVLSPLNIFTIMEEVEVQGEAFSLFMSIQWQSE